MQMQPLYSLHKPQIDSIASNYSANGSIVITAQIYSLWNLWLLFSNISGFPSCGLVAQ